MPHRQAIRPLLGFTTSQGAARLQWAQNWTSPKPVAVTVGAISLLAGSLKERKDTPAVSALTAFNALRAFAPFAPPAGSCDLIDLGAARDVAAGDAAAIRSALTKAAGRSQYDIVITPQADHRPTDCAIGAAALAAAPDPRFDRAIAMITAACEACCVQAQTEPAGTALSVLCKDDDAVRFYAAVEGARRASGLHIACVGPAPATAFAAVTVTRASPPKPWSAMMWTLPPPKPANAP